MDCPFIRNAERTRITCPACGFSMRWDRDTLPRRNCQTPAPDHGPGTELTALIKQLGGQASTGCGCDSLARRMDVWGAAGCREHRAEIVASLTDAAGKWGIGDWLAGGWRAVASGLAWRLSPSDPIGSLVDEAIERAELAAG